MLKRVVLSSLRTICYSKRPLLMLSLGSRRTAYHFSTTPPQNKKEDIEKLKKESKQFYSNYVQKIVQLKSSADFQNLMVAIKDPIILDLYADWCEPCKKLTPKLQSRVNALENIKLVKVNIDKCPEVAHALQVKSVPTVYLLYQGQAIDRIQGNVGDQQLNKFFDNITKLTGISAENKEASETLEKVRQLLGSKQYKEAAEMLQKFNEKKIETSLIALKELFLTQCYVMMNKLSKAKDTLQRASKYEKIFNEAPQLSQFYGIMKQQVEKQDQQSKSDPHVDVLKSEIDKAQGKQDKLEAKFKLVNYFKQKQLTQNALKQAMEIIKQDKNWQEKKTNKLVLAIFKELGNNSPLVQKYRKVLQRLLS